MQVLVLSHGDVVRALQPAECAEAMAAVLKTHARGETYMPLRSVLMPPEAAGFMGLMPAWRGGGEPVFSLKTVCVMPGNPARGLDAHQGIVTLFDGETGQPTAILDASAVTSIRTAAVTAVATGALARTEAATLAIIGAGVQAAAHIEALTLVRPFETINIYAPTAAHAQELAQKTAAAAANVHVSPSAQAAVAEADVVVTATSSKEPVIERSWLKPGTHINAIGASTPNAAEIDTDTVANSALFADSRESIRNEAREFRLAVEEGVIDGEDHVRAELGEVLNETAPGRQSDDELTLFRSLGLAVEDLAAAEHAVASARRLGIGTEVEL
jgi:ornithine cyclodeaminase/alanine dehydrogenase-like protein (mu-crystallin family)